MLKLEILYLRFNNAKSLLLSIIQGRASKSFQGLNHSIFGRVVPIYNTHKSNGKTNYDKEKYRELMLDAAETVLGYFGFDRNLYSDNKNISKRKWWWLEELRQERERDIKIETSENN